MYYDPDDLYDIFNRMDEFDEENERDDRYNYENDALSYEYDDDYNDGEFEELENCEQDFE